MKKYLFLIIALFIIEVPSVNAYELVCSKTNLTAGEEFSCTLTGDASDYSSLSGTITSDNVLSCHKASIAPGLVEHENTSSVSFNLSGRPQILNLLNLTCKVLDDVKEKMNAQIFINDFKYQTPAGEGSEIIKSDFLTVNPQKQATVEKPHNVTDPALRLKQLKVSAGTLTFSQFITDYTFDVLYETTKIDFDYELNNPTSSVRIEGNNNLLVGENVIDIYVKSSDGTKENCYSFTVNRLKEGEEIYYKDRDASLKKLTITGYVIRFQKDIYEYNITIPSDVNSININAEATSDSAIVSVSPTDNLNNGSVVTIEVMSGDETSSNIYRINITKEIPKKSYLNLIISILLVLILFGAIILFIKLSQRQKAKDPLLSLKKNKKGINKGNQFDATSVPEASNTEASVEEHPKEEAINTLDLSASNTVKPMAATAAVDTSFNQVSSLKQTLDLTTNVTPTAVTPQENAPIPPVPETLPENEKTTENLN